MSPDSMITHLVGASALILVVAHSAGWIARRFGQPAIIGQLIAGIALGPTILAELAPGLRETIFPKAITPQLNGLAQIALVLFLFAVGYELDLGMLRNRARTVVSISLAAFVVPMAVGSGAALLFHQQLRDLGAPARLSPATVLFFGVALSITAVPVLTAIVRENGLAGTVPGVIAVSAAGLLDVLGWTVLIGTMLPSTGHQALAWPVRLTLMLVFTAGMLTLARPLLRRLLWRGHMDSSVRLALLVGFALASAWVTNALGLHVIFGALLAGVVVPREPGGTLDPDLVRPLHDVSMLLLPFFFVVSGQSVVVGSLDWAGFVVLLVVTALGVTVKVGSGTVAARATGLSWHHARTVGVLLSARGLTELIALNAGLQARLLSKDLYTVLVLMALATTVLTQPLLALVKWLDGPDGSADAEPHDAPPATEPLPTTAPGTG